jgi:hypothetical protein
MEERVTFVDFWNNLDQIGDESFHDDNGSMCEVVSHQ